MGKDDHIDSYVIAVTLSGSDLVFLDAYAQRYRGEQADIEIANHTRSEADRKADRSAGIRDALALMRQVQDWQFKRGDYDEWSAQREARMRLAQG